MFNELNFGLKRKFDIKCIVDVSVLVLTLVLFMFFAKVKNIAPYDTFTFLFVIAVLNFSVLFFSRQWIVKTIKQSFTAHSSSIAETAAYIKETVNNQRKMLESFNTGKKNISSMILKLQAISEEFMQTSKKTEKQVNQSITFSEKEYDAISANANRMLVLRQKIQMITELILELSEHIQQIGNTIGVVDDIAEQTNMLALNAAVEAARAGEHGKGFAVVAGEIRKLADESKQAITKITSLTNNIQYTTNSTVMATEEGSKEIEAVVKEINSVTTESETLSNTIKQVLESIDLIIQNAQKHNDIIEKLNTIDDEISSVISGFEQNITANSEKIAELSSLSDNIKDSASDV